MTCEQIKENISLYMDNALDNKEKKELEQHIHTCNSCKLEFTQMLDTIDLLHSIPPEELPFNLHEEIMKKVYDMSSEHKIQSVSKKDKFFRLLKPMVAVFLVLIVVGFGVLGIFTLIPTKSITEEMEKNSAPQEMIVRDTANENSDFYRKKMESSTDFAEIENLPEQKIIKTASLFLEVEDFDLVYQKIKQMVEKNKGYIVNAESYIYYSDDEKKEYLKEGHLTIRVPREVYGTAQQQIIELGKLKHQSENSDDITDQYMDTEGKIRMLKVQEERLLVIMENATKVEELIQLEQRLNEVRTDLEILKGRIQNWDKLVAFSTIEVKIRQVKKAMIHAIAPNFSIKIKEGLITSINRAQSSMEIFFINIARNFIQIIFGLVCIIIGIWVIKFLYIKIKFKFNKI